MTTTETEVKKPEPIIYQCNFIDWNKGTFGVHCRWSGTWDDCNHHFTDELNILVTSCPRCGHTIKKLPPK